MNVRPAGALPDQSLRPWQIGRDYDPATASLLCETEDWLPVLRQLDMSAQDMRRIFLRAQASGSTFFAALVDEGAFSQPELTRAMAIVSGLGFAAVLDPDQVLGPDQRCAAELVRSNPVIAASVPGEKYAMSMVLGPHDVAPVELTELSATLRPPVLVPLAALRRALAGRISQRLTMIATQGLFDWRPDLSARYRMSPRQAFAAGVFLVLLALLLWFAPTTFFICLHLFSTVFFFSCSGIKAAAALSFARRKPAKPAHPADMTALPVYSVLVALHREAEIVPQLLSALEKIVWPRDKLEIKLVCEADDRATIEAIEALRPRSYFEIVEAPPSLPRTKPKALRYAMTMISGELVVLYDAEDRPHPEQLLEAHAAFSAAGPQVVCLQAPLEVTNGPRSTLARMFAFEYAGLFRSMLPWLAAHGQVLPLGGTSNHFRRAALDEIGSWDPHNVTEDADVGVRLFRFGYRAQTITLPTLEAAPEELRVWLPQRTRWLKGWLQTWLVHMRYPGLLLSEVGLVSFLYIQVLLAGMFFSALLHPVIFVSAIGYSAMSLTGFGLADWQKWLVGLDWIVLLFSYAVFLVLGWRSLSLRERIGFPVIVLMTPAYWLLTSYAAWLALIEFIRHPHRWNKTPHKPG